MEKQPQIPRATPKQVSGIRRRAEDLIAIRGSGEPVLGSSAADPGKVFVSELQRFPRGTIRHIASAYWQTPFWEDGSNARRYLFVYTHDADDIIAATVKYSLQVRYAAEHMFREWSAIYLVGYDHSIHCYRAASRRPDIGRLSTIAPESQTLFTSPVNPEVRRTEATHIIRNLSEILVRETVGGLAYVPRPDLSDLS